SGWKVMSCPSSTMEPSSGTKLPAMALNSVDLPAPLEPTMVTKSPCSNARSMPVSAFFSLTVPGLKVFCTPWSSSIMAGASLPVHGGVAAALEGDAFLDGGRRDGQHHDDGRDQLERLRRQVGPHGQRNDKAVDDAARHRGH